MPQLIARFTVSGWDDHDLTDVGEEWLGALRMSKTYTSGIVGEATVFFVSSGDVEGQRAYMAAERITGTTDDGGRGSITVHHGGLESSPDTWFGHIVPQSGTGAFDGWSGTAHIEHDADGAFMVFELTELPA